MTKFGEILDHLAKHRDTFARYSIALASDEYFVIEELDEEVTMAMSALGLLIADWLWQECRAHDVFLKIFPDKVRLTCQ